MAEHKYTKEELIQRFDGILEKTFEEIDDIGMFEHVLHEDFKLQKGIAGSVIEQCVGSADILYFSFLEQTRTYAYRVLPI